MERHVEKREIISIKSLDLEVNRCRINKKEAFIMIVKIKFPERSDRSDVQPYYTSINGGGIKPESIACAIDECGYQGYGGEKILRIKKEEDYLILDIKDELIEKE